MMKQRLFTQWAADQMEATLIRKDKEGYKPWETLTHGQRWRAVQREWIEVNAEIEKCVAEERRDTEAIERLQLELTDLALTAMMLAGGFDETMSKLKRGRRG